MIGLGDMRNSLYSILTRLNGNRYCALAGGPAIPVADQNKAPGMAVAGPGSLNIEQALASLTDDERNVLLMVVLKGLTYEEIATLQRIPLGTVMCRLACARAHIEAYLRKCGQHG